MLGADLLEILGGPSQGTKYSLDQACNHCGSGAVPVRDRIVKYIPKNSKRLFYTEDLELLIDEKLESLLEILGIQTLAKVVDLDSKVLPFKELRPQATLPPFSSLTSGYEIEDQCHHCKRDVFFNLRRLDLKLVYENLDPSFLEQDVLKTHELFGGSCIEEPFSESVFGCPKLIVSYRVISIFNSELIESFSVAPIQILNKNSLPMRHFRH